MLINDIFDGPSGLRVYVYYNLNKHCLSVKALEGEKKNKVIGYCHAISIKDVTFKVSQKGRERVLLTGQKHVHAGLVGFVGNFTETLNATAYYNPRQNRYFECASRKELKKAKGAILNGKLVSVAI